MGGLAIEKVRGGVEFVPDAAAAFRRAEAQVQEEFGRNIDVNSTYRSWTKQLSMYDAWNAYAGGWGPYPGHSKAVHPSESFHVSGLALDSDDWRNARIVQILAENGYIRNRLYVDGEDHHFEYIRSRDKNYGKPTGKKAKPKPAAKPLPEPTLEELMAFKSVAIGYRPNEKVDEINSTALDWAEGAKSALALTNKAYSVAWHGALTEGGLVIISKGHYNSVMNEFDAHQRTMRARELEIARTQAG